MNKTAVISGASSGLGYELSKLLITKYGCRVVGLARRAERLDAVRSELGENFLPFVCDVTKDEYRARLLDFINENGIKPDILINNAGILPEFSCFTPERAEELERVMELNFHSHVKMCALFLPLILKSEHGAIVNVASSAALATLPGTAAYSASKSALIGFSKALAKELSPSNVNVNCVCPGVIDTPMNDRFSAEEKRELEEKTPLKRMGTASEIADIIYFLSSEKSNFITGQIITVDGGFTL